MKEKVLQIIKSAMGGAEDNLYRANCAFGKMTDQQLDQKYGQSDQTCREILNGYARQKEKYLKCIAWVEGK